MRETGKMGIRLLIVCAVAGLCLALTYSITQPKIEEQERLAEQEAYMALFPEGAAFDEVDKGNAADGTLSGIRIGSNSETAGLGARIVEPDFYEQYAGQTPPINLGEQVQAITGATISSRAVTNGVNLAFEAVQPML